MRVIANDWSRSNFLTVFYGLSLFAVTIACTNFVSAASDDTRLSVEVLSWPLEFPEQSESTILADRILAYQNDALLFDTEKRNNLISEIEQILKLVRETYPATAEISAIENHRPGALVVGLTSEFMKSVSGIVSGGNRYITLHTGNEEFDALNIRLGVHAIEPHTLFNNVILHFKFPVNLLRAQFEYSMIEGVDYVELDSRLGDYPDIDIVKSNNEWFLIFRKAWGDCPSGCLFEEFMFFRVREGKVKQIKEKMFWDSMKLISFSWPPKDEGRKRTPARNSKIDLVARIRQELLPKYLFITNSSVPQTAFVKGEYNPFVFFV